MLHITYGYLGDVKVLRVWSTLSGGTGTKLAFPLAACWVSLSSLHPAESRLHVSLRWLAYLPHG